MFDVYFEIVERRYRVLYVDNNFALRQTLQRALEFEGFQVVTACHGMDALMQYQACRENLEAVVTNKLEFVRYVRKAGYQGRMILMSGKNIEDLEVCQRYSIYICHKPLELEFLISLLLREN